MAELFAWLVKEDDGREGLIAAEVPEIGITPVPLVASNRQFMEAIAPIAQAHADRSGKPVRLVRFVEAETVKKL
jgi:hypothetical protein